MSIQPENPDHTEDREVTVEDHVAALDSIVTDLTANAPRVSEEIISALGAGDENRPSDTVTNPETAPSGPVASSPGADVFNPDLHEVDENGNPRRTKDGKRFRRKRGPKSTTTGDDTPAAASPVDYRGTAVFITTLFFGAAKNALGDGWEPDPSERANIETQAVRYCESKEIADIPPGIALTLALAMYALPRISLPETKERLRSLGVLKDRSQPETRPIPNPEPSKGSGGTENGSLSRITKSIYGT